MYRSSSFSTESLDIMELLKKHHNVILVGPPAVGKSHLMAEVRALFITVDSEVTVYDSEEGNPFPQQIKSKAELLSSKQNNRQVFSTTFHQNTNYQNFISGLSPAVSNTMSFEVTTGPFYDAFMHAKQDDCAALLEIDELNRGPVISIFGDLITGIESDKRTLPNNTHGPLSYPVRFLHKDGMIRENAIPYHLYILCSMNYADSAVDPIDIAFLRRFVVYRLYPDFKKVRRNLNLNIDNLELPITVGTTPVIFEALIRCCIKLNEVIEYTRGIDFQIGHGIILGELRDEPIGLAEALSTIEVIWGKIYIHLAEIYNGDKQMLAELLNVQHEFSPFTFDEIQFGGNIYFRLSLVPLQNIDDYYNLFRSIIDRR